MGIIGTLRKQPEGFQAFVPAPFPPKRIPLSPRVEALHSDAIRLIGKLDGVTDYLPDKDYFLEMFVRKDASSSSQIEGTKASMMDAIEAENVERASSLPEDVDDILHYIEALNYGLDRVQQLPLSMRLIREMHKILMRDARRTHNPYPGEFRRTQNWIGGTRPGNAHFVPPPVHEMNQALSDLERYIHADSEQLPLVKAGLIHAQFETIHPFADGNGRTGRILITMFIWQQQLLEMPVLYLSSYFNRHKQTYYDHLDGYHSDRSLIEAWLTFFLEGVIETATDAIGVCRKITTLREEDMRKAHALGKVSAATTVEVLRNLYRLPTVGVADIVSWTKFTRPGAYKVIERLEKLKILEPLKEPDTYGQKYVYRRYVDIFTEESE